MMKKILLSSIASILGILMLIACFFWVLPSYDPIGTIFSFVLGHRSYFFVVGASFIFSHRAKLFWHYKIIRFFFRTGVSMHIAMLISYFLLAVLGVPFLIVGIFSLCILAGFAFRGIREDFRFAIGSMLLGGVGCLVGRLIPVYTKEPDPFVIFGQQANRITLQSPAPVLPTPKRVVYVTDKEKKDTFISTVPIFPEGDLHIVSFPSVTTGNRIMSVLLWDGTIVSLTPQSSVSFSGASPRSGTGLFLKPIHLRILQGNAFISFVRKDREKNFVLTGVSVQCTETLCKLSSRQDFGSDQAYFQISRLHTEAQNLYFDGVQASVADLYSWRGTYKFMVEHVAYQKLILGSFFSSGYQKYLDNFIKYRYALGYPISSGGSVISGDWTVISIPGQTGNRQTRSFSKEETNTAYNETKKLSSVGLEKTQYLRGLVSFLKKIKDFF